MKKTNKRVLLISILTVLMCVALIAGATFAWFTSTKKSKIVVTAGTLEVGLEKYNEETGLYEDITYDGANVFADGWWEPGYTSYAAIRIVNKGVLSFKYTISIDGATEDSKKLAEVLEVYYLDNGTNEDIPETRSELFANFESVGTLDGQIAKGAEGFTNGFLLGKEDKDGPDTYDYAIIALRMSEEAGDEYQGMTGEYDITIYATQMDSESDAFGPDYDKDPDSDKIPGSSIDNPVIIHKGEVEGTHTASEELEEAYFQLPSNDEEVEYTVNFNEELFTATYYPNSSMISSYMLRMALAEVQELHDGDTIIPASNSIIKMTAKEAGNEFSFTLSEVVVIEYNVTFDLNYDGAPEAPEAQTIVEGGKVTAPAEPTREGYIFLGWFAEGSEEAWNFEEDVVTDDMTLTAHWEKEPIVGTAYVELELDMAKEVIIPQAGEATIAFLCQEGGNYTLTFEGDYANLTFKDIWGDDLGDFTFDADTGIATIYFDGYPGNDDWYSEFVILGEAGQTFTITITQGEQGGDEEPEYTIDVNGTVNVTFNADGNFIGETVINLDFFVLEDFTYLLKVDNVVGAGIIVMNIYANNMDGEPIGSLGGWVGDFIGGEVAITIPAFCNKLIIAGNSTETYTFTADISLFEYDEPVLGGALEVDEVLPNVEVGSYASPTAVELGESVKPGNYTLTITNPAFLGTYKVATSATLNEDEDPQLDDSNGYMATITITEDTTHIYIYSFSHSYDYVNLLLEVASGEVDVPEVEEIFVGQEAEVVITSANDATVEKTIYLEEGEYTITLSGDDAAQVVVWVKDNWTMGDGGTLIGEYATSGKFTVTETGTYSLMFQDADGYDGCTITVLIAKVEEVVEPTSYDLSLTEPAEGAVIGVGADNATIFNLVEVEAGEYTVSLAVTPGTMGYSYTLVYNGEELTLDANNEFSAKITVVEDVKTLSIYCNDADTEDELVLTVNLAVYEDGGEEPGDETHTLHVGVRETITIPESGKITYNADNEAYGWFIISLENGDGITVTNTFGNNVALNTPVEFEANYELTFKGAANTTFTALVEEYVEQGPSDDELETLSVDTPADVTFAIVVEGENTVRAIVKLEAEPGTYTLTLSNITASNEWIMLSVMLGNREVASINGWPLTDGVNVTFEVMAGEDRLTIEGLGSGKAFNATLTLEAYKAPEPPVGGSIFTNVEVTPGYALSGIDISGVEPGEYTLTVTDFEIGWMGAPQYMINLTGIANDSDKALNEFNKYTVQITISGEPYLYIYSWGNSGDIVTVTLEKIGGGNVDPDDPDEPDEPDDDVIVVGKEKTFVIDAKNDGISFLNVYLEEGTYTITISGETRGISVDNETSWTNLLDGSKNQTTATFTIAAAGWYELRFADTASWKGGQTITVLIEKDGVDQPPVKEPASYDLSVDEPQENAVIGDSLEMATIFNLIDVEAGEYTITIAVNSPADYQRTFTVMVGEVSYKLEAANDFTATITINGEKTILIYVNTELAGETVTVTLAKVGGEEPAEYTVSFNLNYEDAPEAPEAQTIVEGGHATAPEAPEREGYTFLGWFDAEVDGNEWDFDVDVVNGDVTLYAYWQLDEVDEPEEPKTERFEFDLKETIAVGTKVLENDLVTVTVVGAELSGRGSSSTITWKPEGSEEYVPINDTHTQSTAGGGNSNRVAVLNFELAEGYTYTIRMWIGSSGSARKVVLNGVEKDTGTSTQFEMLEWADLEAGSYDLTQNGNAKFYKVIVIATPVEGGGDVDEPIEAKDVKLNFGLLENIDELVAACGNTDSSQAYELYNDGATVITANPGVRINTSNKNFSEDTEGAIDVKFTHRLQTRGRTSAANRSVVIKIADAAVITVYARSSSDNPSGRWFGFYDGSYTLLQQEDAPTAQEGHIYTYSASEAGTIILGTDNGFDIYYITVEYTAEGGDIEEPTEFTVTFVYADEETEDLELLTENGKVANPGNPEREGYEFLGWYTAEGEVWDFENEVTEDMTLTAFWKELPKGYDLSVEEPQEDAVIGGSLEMATIFNLINVEAGEYTINVDGGMASWQSEIYVVVGDVTYTLSVLNEFTDKITINDEKVITIYTNGATLENVTVTLAKYVEEVPPTNEPETVSVTIATLASENGWANESNHPTITIGEVTATATRTNTSASSNNTGNYYTSGNGVWRVYQSEGSELTFVASEGYEIVSIKVTYGNNNGGVLIGSDSNNYSSNTTVSVNATSYTFTVGSTTGKTNGRVDINAIEVTYVSTATPEPPVVEDGKIHLVLGEAVPVVLGDNGSAILEYTATESGFYTINFEGDIEGLSIKDAQGGTLGVDDYTYEDGVLRIHMDGTSDGYSNSFMVKGTAGQSFTATINAPGQGGEEEVEYVLTVGEELEITPLGTSWDPWEIAVTLKDVEEGKYTLTIKFSEAIYFHTVSFNAGGKAVNVNAPFNGYSGGTETLEVKSDVLTISDNSPIYDGDFGDIKLTIKIEWLEGFEGGGDIGGGDVGGDGLTIGVPYTVTLEGWYGADVKVAIPLVGVAPGAYTVAWNIIDGKSNYADWANWYVEAGSNKVQIADMNNGYTAPVTITIPEGCKELVFSTTGYNNTMTVEVTLNVA